MNTDAAAAAAGGCGDARASARGSREYLFFTPASHSHYGVEANIPGHVVKMCGELKRQMVEAESHAAGLCSEEILSAPSQARLRLLICVFARETRSTCTRPPLTLPSQILLAPKRKVGLESTCWTRKHARGEMNRPPIYLSGHLCQSRR